RRGAAGADGGGGRTRRESSGGRGRRDPCALGQALQPRLPRQSSGGRGREDPPEAARAGRETRGAGSGVIAFVDGEIETKRWRGLEKYVRVHRVAPFELPH